MALHKKVSMGSLTIHRNLCTTARGSHKLETAEFQQ